MTSQPRLTIAPHRNGRRRPDRHAPAEAGRRAEVLKKGGEVAARVGAGLRSGVGHDDRSPAIALADRAWRSFAQVLFFAAFGVGGALLTLTAPLAQREPAAARRRVQRLLAAYTAAMRALRLIDLEFKGVEHLRRRGVLIVANHPTLIDAFFLLAAVDQLVPVAKRALLANPFTRGAIRAADYAINDDGPELIDACRERLARGELLLVFPEGTRSGTGELRLRRGAAQVAVRTICPVVPVTVQVTERFLTRDTRWWLAPKTAPRFRITAFAPIDPAPFIAAGSPALAARRLTEHLHRFFSRELSARGSV